MIDMIECLIKKGYGYQSDDESPMQYRMNKFDNYGYLARLDQEE